MTPRMLEAQKPIAEWLDLMIRKHGVSARNWALKAKLGKDTVSRAMKSDYEFVTKISTLVKLADVIGEQAPGAGVAIPSASSLEAVLQVLLAAVAPSPALDDLTVASLAKAFRDTLVHLADEPQSQIDPQAARLLARATVRQLDLSNA